MNLRRAAGGLFLVAAAIGIAQWPVVTRFGVNYQTYSKQIPLAEKGIQFLDRHLQTRRLAKEITQGIAGDEEKLLKIFSWVMQNVQPVPAGLPVVDDHLFNVVIRGYGASDQRTEVFALLASYCGFPAAAVCLEDPASARCIDIAFVRLGDKMLLFDVANGLLFQDETGRLLTREDLVGNPRWIQLASGGRKVYGVDYEVYFLRLPEIHPTFTRMEDQKPLYRLRASILSLLGIGSSLTAQFISCMFIQ